MADGSLGAREELFYDVFLRQGLSPYWARKQAKVYAVLFAPDAAPERVAGYGSGYGSGYARSG